MYVKRTSYYITHSHLLKGHQEVENNRSSQTTWLLANGSPLRADTHTRRHRHRHTHTKSTQLKERQESKDFYTPLPSYTHEYMCVYDKLIYCITASQWWWQMFSMAVYLTAISSHIHPCLEYLHWAVSVCAVVTWCDESAYKSELSGFEWTIGL